jgi:CRP-like cAMP-binding protein
MDHLNERHPDCFLCHYAVAAWRPAIETNAVILRFKRGETLFREDDPVKGFFFIHSGSVKIHKRWGSHKELIIKFARKMDILGHRGMVGSQFYPITATAIEDCQVCFVSTAFFHDTLLVNHELAYQMVLFYAAELHRAELGMRNMVHMDVKSRVADALLKLKEGFGQNPEGYINCQLSRQDLASFAGTTYETLFKALQELSEDRVIGTAGKSIAIRDEEQLRRQIRWD